MIVHHDRSDGDKRVIHSPCILDVAGLEGQLKTTTAHPEAHSVHVDVVIESGPISCLCLYGWRLVAECIQMGHTTNQGLPGKYSAATEL